MPATEDVGPCWWEDCDDAGVEVVTGVPVTPVGGKEIDAAAERMTRLGIVTCADHTQLAVTLAGLR